MEVSPLSLSAAVAGGPLCPWLSDSLLQAMWPHGLVPRGLLHIRTPS